MKKVLLTLAIAIAFSGLTTGCAAKKRVQKLEAELMRCKETNARLKQQATHTEQPDETVSEEDGALAARDESNDSE